MSATGPKEPFHKEIPLYIRFLGILNSKTIKAVLETIETAMKSGQMDVYLAMKSPGGAAFAGQYMQMEFEKLQQEGLRLTIHNRTMIHSAAMLPYLAAQRRLVEPDATFLIHPPKPPHDPQQIFSAKTVENLLALHQDAMVECLLRYTPIEKTAAVILAQNESLLTADEGVQLGISDGIAPIIIPADARCIDHFYPNSTVEE